MGEYQPLYDQTECKKCPNGYTSLRGSKSPDDCFVKVDKPCQSKPCGANGRCVPDNSLFHCDCASGFTGEFFKDFYELINHFKLQKDQDVKYSKSACQLHALTAEYVPI